MEWPSTSWNVFGSANMIEQAKEELEILEDQHPNKFEYLKLELRSFISFLESNNSDSVPSTSAATQESSSNRKRKNGSYGSQDNQEPKKKLQKIVLDPVSCTKRSRIDVVMERAKACLEKIQRFKTSNK
ncbi:PREDICTED: uncharacterized protein LOC109237555 [Nicotiana attenuata]|uniref:Uncharacterized protein n=1 Tax=Nicotiana attenuata TaxID=49451 RepID=A0A314LE65_NICAT|nr:PREDICTED: uncharacterized protein LOC109237555 [Nicotiana attenuata]OIT39853.1 hypothetical protein A4A49_26311 [Nicotiana attenuata]